MSEYNDGQYENAPRNSLYPESPLGRQSNGYPAPGTRRTPRYSRASNPSWVSNGMLSPHPPGSVSSRPLPAPSPPPSRGPGTIDFRPSYPTPSELDQEEEPEPYQPYAGQPMSEARSEREWEDQGEVEAMSIGPSANEERWTDGGGYDGPPQEQGHEQVFPEHEPYAYPLPPDEREPKPHGRAKNFVGGFVAGLRKLPKAVVKSHFYDRKATRKGAPGTEMSPGQSHFLPAYDDPGTTVLNPESVHYVQGMHMPGPGPAPQSPTELSYADPTRRSSQQRTSLSQHRASQRSSSHAHGSHAHASQAVVASIASSPRFRSPEPVDPLPASDYAKMDSPIRFAPPDDSFSTHIARVQNFFHELKNLPWTSERVALDYVPARSPRAHIGKAKPHGSWYTGVNQKGHQEIDLLAPAPVPARRGTIQSRSEASASIRSGGMRMQPDGRTPASYMTSPGGLLPSPGASSHGQGHQMMSYSYYFAPPQPLYVYQSPMTMPMAHGGTASSSSSGMSRSPEAHQAVPVYMMAGPPPGLIPSPPPAAHGTQHNQVNRAVSPQVSIQIPGRPTSHAQSRHSGTGTNSR